MVDRPDVRMHLQYRRDDRRDRPVVLVRLGHLDDLVRDHVRHRTWRQTSKASVPETGC